jgi:hypothetical protein
MDCIISACLRPVGNLAVGMALNALRGVTRRFMVPCWLRQLTIARRTRTDAISTSATRAVNEYVRAKAPGGTVFWTVSGAGKTTAVAASCAGRIVVVDWERCGSATKAIDWFASKVGWDGPIGEFFADEFATVVLDHFDHAMDVDIVSAKKLFRSLVMDSAESRAFNVIACVNDAAHALELLRATQRFTNLLGPSFCGRCTEEEVRRAGFESFPLELGASSGAMDMAVAASLRNVRDDSLRLQAAQASDAWERGESLLASYRRAI